MADLPGDVLEVGVWRGGTGACWRSRSASSAWTPVILADTFRGVVGPVTRTRGIGGEHADTSWRRGPGRLSGVRNRCGSRGVRPASLAAGAGSPDSTKATVDGLAPVECPAVGSRLRRARVLPVGPVPHRRCCGLTPRLGASLVAGRSLPMFRFVRMPKAIGRPGFVAGSGRGL
ncbi:MAG: hypothetical protein IPI82_09975 [Candidatus Microthrix sp.]|nr:hypothetical protein [Candidatus Microthrix sp.]